MSDIVTLLRVAANHPDNQHGANYWLKKAADDPDRQAILLVGGDKSGGSEKRFYKQLIARADERFDRHLAKRKG